MSRRRGRRNRRRQRTFSPPMMGSRCYVPGGLAELASGVGEGVALGRRELTEAARLGWLEFPDGIPEDPTAPLVGYLTIPAGAGR